MLSLGRQKKWMCKLKIKNKLPQSCQTFCKQNTQMTWLFDDCFLTVSQPKTILQTWIFPLKFQSTLVNLFFLWGYDSFNLTFSPHFLSWTLAWEPPGGGIAGHAAHRCPGLLLMAAFCIRISMHSNRIFYPCHPWRVWRVRFRVTLAS